MSNRIELIVRNGRRIEGAANAALKPGHLLERMSTGKLRKHTTYGGQAERIFALENALLGGTIDDAYAADDLVEGILAGVGDVINARVPANAPAITVGSLLISNGDGCLIKPTTNGTHTLYANAAASTAISNGVSTEQDFSLTYAIPANTLQVGDVVVIKGHAVVSAAAGTDTLTVKIYIGSTVIAATAAVNATTADIVSFELTLVVRTIGASGTFVAMGYVCNGVIGTATALPLHLASTTIDTTAAKTIKASATWSATTATCTVALQSLIVEMSRVVPNSILASAEEAVDNSAGASEAFCAARIMSA
jgi:hypothetical protein